MLINKRWESFWRCTFISISVRPPCGTNGSLARMQHNSNRCFVSVNGCILLWGGGGIKGSIRCKRWPKKKSTILFCLTEIAMKIHAEKQNNGTEKIVCCSSGLVVLCTALPIHYLCVTPRLTRIGKKKKKNTEKTKHFRTCQRRTCI